MELARPFPTTLPPFSQHFDVLEESGLVESSKISRTRTYRLAPRPLRAEERWMEQQRGARERRLDQPDHDLDGLMEKNP